MIIHDVCPLQDFFKKRQIYLKTSSANATHLQQPPHIYLGYAPLLLFGLVTLLGSTPHILELWKYLLDESIILPMFITYNLQFNFHMQLSPEHHLLVLLSPMQ